MSERACILPWVWNHALCDVGHVTWTELTDILISTNAYSNLYLKPLYCCVQHPNTASILIFTMKVIAHKCMALFFTSMCKSALPMARPYHHSHKEHVQITGALGTSLLTIWSSQGQPKSVTHDTNALLTIWSSQGQPKSVTHDANALLTIWSS